MNMFQSVGILTNSLVVSCPQLRNIGSSVNEDHIQPKSQVRRGPFHLHNLISPQLFAFNDLLGFSLMLKPRPARKCAFSNDVD